MPFDATARPLWLNLLAFALSAAFVWLAGTRLSRYAELITERTHAGGVLVGTLLLGVVASLPEAVVSVTAAAMGNARLAVNTLLGGVVFSLLIVAVTDGLIGKEALSSDIRHPVVPLQGVLAILMLVCAAAGIGAGDVGALGVGAWTSGLLLLYVLTVLLVKHVQRSLPWVVGREGHPPPDEAAAPVSAGSRRSLRSVVLCTVLAALAIVVAGFVAAVTADALSEQTGLGPSFAGFVLGGVATSLPEASSTYAAVRLKRLSAEMICPRSSAQGIKCASGWLSNNTISLPLVLETTKWLPISKTWPLTALGEPANVSPRPGCTRRMGSVPSCCEVA